MMGMISQLPLEYFTCSHDTTVWLLRKKRFEEQESELGRCQKALDSEEKKHGALRNLRADQERVECFNHAKTAALAQIRELGTLSH
jgi:hypothetical protein